MGVTTEKKSIFETLPLGLFIEDSLKDLSRYTARDKNTIQSLCGGFHNLKEVISRTFKVLKRGFFYVVNLSLPTRDAYG